MAIWSSRLILGNDKRVRDICLLHLDHFDNDNIIASQIANLVHYSSYTESPLIPTANPMLNFVLKHIRHELCYKKYAGNWCVLMDPYKM